VIDGDGGEPLDMEMILEGLMLNVSAMDAEASLRMIYDMGAAFGGESGLERIRDLYECLTWKRADTAKLTRDMLRELARTSRPYQGNALPNTDDGTHDQI